MDELLEHGEPWEIEPGGAYFAASFRDAALLIVEDGFVVLRSVPAKPSRSVITCEAGPGRILLPPADDEVLVALVRSRIRVIDRAGVQQMAGASDVARELVEQLSFTLAQKQEAIANFAQLRHVERVRRKLLQLGRSYGHVARDGVRIDFPVSHAILAEMIGSSRETVTRAIDDLQRRGFVARRGTTYRLLVSPEAVFGVA